MRARSFLTGFAVAVASAAGAVAYRRRAGRGRERAELYFADGTMVSLADGSAGADRLLPPARDLLAAAR
jgi:hypothetical protein